MSISSTYKTDADRVLVRLEESSSAVRGYFAQWNDEVEVRDKIILEAVSAGVEILTIARRAQLSDTRIHQIIARRWPR